MHEKTEQYQEVKMQQTWKVKSKVVPAIIGALGDISSVMYTPNWKPGRVAPADSTYNIQACGKQSRHAVQSISL